MGMSHDPTTNRSQHDGGSETVYCGGDGFRSASAVIQSGRPSIKIIRKATLRTMGVCPRGRGTGGSITIISKDAAHSLNSVKVSMRRSWT